MAIDARIRIALNQKDFASESEYHAAQHIDLLKQAAVVAAELKKDVIRVEVEYPSDTKNGSWDVAGDALEINVTNEFVATLPAYSELAP